ncbi:LLM class flavin-dependent oxidoreductase [Mycobacterium vicinigordonae]|uniref:LLM class flavin-dependent oxidoreductase n=1 Tax=Mycobacterium vicinigordonae TaxID=1719132 RepID=UPI001BB30F26
MTIRQPLAQITGTARRTRAAGFSGLLFTETGRTTYLNAAIAPQAAPGLQLSMGVAVVSPREAVRHSGRGVGTARASNGNIRRGLGTQVRTHVVRRYGVEVRTPGPRLRECGQSASSPMLRSSCQS